MKRHPWPAELRHADLLAPGAARRVQGCRSAWSCAQPRDYRPHRRGNDARITSRRRGDPGLPASRVVSRRRTSTTPLSIWLRPLRLRPVSVWRNTSVSTTRASDDDLARGRSISPLGANAQKRLSVLLFFNVGRSRHPTAVAGIERRLDSYPGLAGGRMLRLRLCLAFSLANAPLLRLRSTSGRTERDARAPAASSRLPCTPPGAWRGGTTAERCDFLHVKEMEITHIELLPVMEHPFPDRGAMSSGFWKPESKVLARTLSLCGVIDGRHFSKTAQSIQLSEMRAGLHWELDNSLANQSLDNSNGLRVDVVAPLDYSAQ